MRGLAPQRELNVPLGKAAETHLRAADRVLVSRDGDQARKRRVELHDVGHRWGSGAALLVQCRDRARRPAALAADHADDAVRPFEPQLARFGDARLHPGQALARNKGAVLVVDHLALGGDEPSGDGIRYVGQNPVILRFPELLLRIAAPDVLCNDTLDGAAVEELPVLASDVRGRHRMALDGLSGWFCRGGRGEQCEGQV